MEIKKHLTKVNYTPSNKQNKYIVIHYTANDGDTAQGNSNYFYSVNRNASANYFIGEKEIYQVVLDKDIAWHCGAKTYKHPLCRNNNSIGIELCSRKDNNNNNYYFDKDTINNSIKLVSSLMHKYNIPFENVIRHYDVTGKLCPRPLIDNTAWQGYITLLKNELKGVNLNDKKEVEYLYQNIKDVPEWSKNTIEKLIEKGCFADVNKMDLTDDMIRTFVIMDRYVG